MKWLNRAQKLFLATLIFTLVSCAPAMQNSQAYPNPSAEEPNPDAVIYAQNNNIPVEEAVRQFHLQDAAGELQETLREKESDTFRAIWIERVPEFKIVVLFSRDPERTIKPYLTDELRDVVEARTVDESLAMLEDAKQDVLSSLLELGIESEAKTNVYENRITLSVSKANRVLLNNALEENHLELPQNVDVVTVWTLWQDNDPDAPSLGGHFPQLLITPGASYDLPYTEGTLILENGCLRLSGVQDMLNGDNFLLIWDARFSTRTEDGIVQVIDSLTGEVLASVGETIGVSFNGGNLNRPTWRPIPDECSGPYFIVGQMREKTEKP